MLSWFPQSPVTSDAPPDGAKSSDAPNETSLPGEQSRTLNEQARTEDALPHDRILGNLLQGQDGSEKGNGSLHRPSVLDTSSGVYDPFDGSFLGSLVAPDHNVQPEEQGKLNDVAAKNEELWSNLSRVLELQNQISRMHLDMEEIGLNATDPKGKGKGTRSRATSVSRVVIDDTEGDEGIGGKRDEEAEINKAREEQFANLAGQFRGKKEAINAIMAQLDSLSKAVTEFHALQIDFPASRHNSLPVPSTAAENQSGDHGQFKPAMKTAAASNVLKRVGEPEISPVLVDSPMSTMMPLPP